MTANKTLTKSTIRSWSFGSRRGDMRVIGMTSEVSILLSADGKLAQVAWFRSVADARAAGTAWKASGLLPVSPQERGAA